MRTFLSALPKQKNQTDLYSFFKEIRLIVILSFLFISHISVAQISSTPSGGSWAAGTTWVGGNVPTLTDDVIIVAGANVAVRDSYDLVNTAVCNSLTVSGTLTMGNSIPGGTDRGLKISTFFLINAGGVATNDGTALHEISLGGNFTNNGTFNALVSTPGIGTTQLNFIGLGTQVIDGTSSTQNFQRLIINKSSGQVTTTGGNVTTINASRFRQTSGDFAAPATFSVSGDLTLTSGTYTAGANTFIGGNFDGALAASFVPGTGTVTFNGSGPQSLAGLTTPTTLYNVITSGTADVNVDYNLNIGGNLSIGSGSKFTVKGYDLNITGSTTIGGSFIFSTSTLGTKTFDGALTVSAGGTWDNSFGENARIGSGISNNGTFIAGSGQYIFRVNSQTISGTFAMADVSIDPGVTLLNSGTLTITTSLAGAGTLQQGLNSVLNLGGTSAVASINATTAINTVNYTGSSQAIKGANYSNLGFSGSGVKSLNTSTNAISGDLTLSGSVTTTTTTSGLTIGGDLSIGTNTSLTNGNGVNGITLSVGKSISGGGTLIQTANSILNIGGSNSTLSSINAAAAGNSVTYTGASPLIIPGSYLGLTLNQSSGDAALNGNISVAGTLTLSTGSLQLASNNLTLGNTAILSITSPSATRMIITSGTGELRKNFSSVGSFTFPIGEATGTVEYSPVTVHVTSSTGFIGAYIGASAVDAKFTSNNSTADFLTRYWKITQSGISNCVATVTGTYFASDIVGTESNIAAGQLNGTFDQINNGWKKFSTLSGGSLSAAGSILISGQESVFTGITGANPTVSITGGGVAVCIGTPVSLGSTVTGEPTITYSWSPSTGLSASNVANPTATPATTTTYTLTIYDGNGSSASTTSTINVSALPVVSAGSRVCIGSTITLSPTTGGTWTSSDNTKASVTNAGVVTGVAVGNATFTFTNTTTGCSATTTSVAVNALPIVSAGPQVCVGSTITLSPTTGGTWISSDNTKASVTNAGVVTGVAAGNATFTFTNTTTGCNATTTSVVVNALPVVSAGSQVCVGSTITLSPTTGGTWTSSDNTKASVTNAGVVTGVAVGNATFTFANTTTGCSATTTSVAVNALPIVSAGPQVCVGSTITLSPTTGGTWISSDNTKASVTNAGVVTGVAAGTVTFTFTNTTTGCSKTTSTVLVNGLPVVSTPSPMVRIGTTMTISPSTGGTWISSAPGVATIDNAGLVTGISSGTVTFTFTSTATGCSNATTLVTVNDLPTVSTPSSVLCVGASMTATPSTGGTWISSAPGVATINNAGLVTGISAGVVTFTFTQTSTGYNNTTSTVTVNASPIVSTPSATLCVGSTITLSPTTGGTWISSDNTKATVTSAGVVTGFAAGNVTFTFTNPTTGCSATTTSVAVNALPVKPIITSSNLTSATPTLTSSSDLGNQWFKNGVAITGATSKVLNVSADGSYTVQVTTNGCTGPISDAVAIIITGIEDNMRLSNSRIYPNPTKEVIQIDWSDFKAGVDIDVKIYDQLGRSILTKVMASSDNVLDVRSLVQGPYVFLARQKNMMVIQRFIKE